MSNVRPLNKKYGLTKNQFMSVYYFCKQYDEWKSELNRELSLKSQNITGMPGTFDIGNPTADTAIKHAEMMEKMRIVENSVMAAVGGNKVMYRYMLEGVTKDDVTYESLRKKGMPCGRTAYYEMRRMCYAYVAKKI